MSVVLWLLGIIVVVVAILAFRYRPADHSRYDMPLTAPVIRDDEVSAAHEDVVAKLKAFTSSRSTDVRISRQQMEELFYRDVDARIVPVDCDGVPGEWVLAEGADPDRRLLYLHGGAFRVGSPRSHRLVTFELSRRAGVSVLCIDYRMQPEFKTVDCHDDARTAYDWMVRHSPAGESGLPDAVFVAGDSAGGNLTLSTLAWCRDTERRMPDAAIALAPLTDSTLSSPTWKRNLKSDPFLAPGIGPMFKVPSFVLRIGVRIMAGLPPNHPTLSPLLGDLAGLPPTLIQVSRDEMTYGDAQRYANKAAEAGSPVTLQVWPKMVHVFQGFPELPETDDAYNRMAAFLLQFKVAGTTDVAAG